MVTQHAGLRIVQAQRGNIRTHAAPQRRCDRAEQLARIEVGDDGVGDIEKQVELIALALQNGQEIGEMRVGGEDACDVHNPVRSLIEDIKLITDTLHSASL